MKKLIIKNNVKAIVRELDKDNSISSVSSDVAKELEEKALGIIEEGIERARKNNRRTLFGRDL
jgi:histone H3/H4